ncbi:hypothetical protein M0R45_025947 [Rubus argutus]|uniref:Uncharacterized protein n=1 Tax=Rubus argutus TaxID=59490 RepID=A0AAW1WWS6_RUBAR
MLCSPCRCQVYRSSLICRPTPPLPASASPHFNHHLCQPRPPPVSPPCSLPRRAQPRHCQSNPGCAPIPFPIAPPCSLPPSPAFTVTVLRCLARIDLFFQATQRRLRPSLPAGVPPVQRLSPSLHALRRTLVPTPALLLCGEDEDIKEALHGLDFREETKKMEIRV